MGQWVGCPSYRHLSSWVMVLGVRVLQNKIKVSEAGGGKVKLSCSLRSLWDAWWPLLSLRKSTGHS